MKERKQANSWNAQALSVGMDPLIPAKSLISGARDGARTRDLRRDRPAL
jgi:hypothetical protein